MNLIFKFNELYVEGHRSYGERKESMLLYIELNKNSKLKIPSGIYPIYSDTGFLAFMRGKGKQVYFKELV